MQPTQQQALLLLGISNEIYASPMRYAINKSAEISLANYSKPITTAVNTTIITKTFESIYTNGNTTTNTSHLELIEECSISSATEELYWSHFGTQLAVPEWEAILTTVVLSIIIVLTIIGNVLVILSVFTYKPLRIVQNFFIVSLAVADLTVALLVLPFNVAYSILGRWEFGIHICKMWLTCDVLCCTSSILNLCAIALDRYWAITDPINYAQKRTLGRVLLLIAGVWVLSFIISSPPLVGWNDWPDEFTSATPCELTTNRGYVIYSSLGSFFIPLSIMTIVYIEIYIATRRRLRERAKAAKINTIAMKSGDNCAPTVSNLNTRRESFALASMCLNILSCGKSSTESTSSVIIPKDRESISSETNINNETLTRTNDQDMKQSTRGVVAPRKKTRRSRIKDSIEHGKMRVRKQQQKIDFQSYDDEKPASAGAIVRELLMVAEIKTLENCEMSGDNSEQRATSESTGGTNDVNHYENTSLKITPPQSSAGATSAAAMSKPSAVYQFIEEKQKISLSKERRAARTLGIIMGVFVICWLPFFLMYVILPFCDTCCPTNKFKNFITWLGYINSGLNPVIYTIFNLDYRRAFKRLLGFQ